MDSLNFSVGAFTAEHVNTITYRIKYGSVTLGVFCGNTPLTKNTKRGFILNKGVPNCLNMYFTANELKELYLLSRQCEQKIRKHEKHSRKI